MDSNQIRGDRRRRRGPTSDRDHARRHRTEARADGTLRIGTAVAPGPKDGGHRQSHRRRRPRFQQSPVDHPRAPGNDCRGAQRPSAASRVDRRLHQGRRPRCVADAQHAGLLPQAAIEARRSRRRRRGRRVDGTPAPARSAMRSKSNSFGPPICGGAASTRCSCKTPCSIWR